MKIIIPILYVKYSWIAIELMYIKGSLFQWVILRVGFRRVTGIFVGSLGIGIPTREAVPSPKPTTVPRQCALQDHIQTLDIHTKKTTLL